MVVALRAQYRMAADIMLLANTIVYDGQLRCGADRVAEAVLDLHLAPSQISHPRWLTQVRFQPWCVQSTRDAYVLLHMQPHT